MWSPLPARYEATPSTPGTSNPRNNAAGSSTESGSDRVSDIGADSDRLQAIERDHILRALQETRWIVGGPGPRDDARKLASVE
jgi:hypothetical protein